MVMSRFRMAASAVLGCLWLAIGIPGAHAALFISGPVEALPGGLVTLSIGLDAPLVADIDELQLHLDFDPAVLHPQAAAGGSLLCAGSDGATLHPTCVSVREECCCQRERRRANRARTIRPV